jgi:hypothetical protein
MAMALERAAQRTGRPIVWLNSGWTEAKEDEAAFHAETRKLCPSVDYRHVDGRRPETRFSIWAAADIFISFSDNIQETFGLTPIEAMAAGLPCVVSDWDGYKDTVRDGVDGFRIPTIAPRPGLGADIAFAFANRWMSYENYIGASGQFVAVDLGAAEEALAALIEQPELRRRMGEAGRARAREVFDWAAIVPQYQALWAEQNARRQAAPDNSQGLNPYRPDPFTLFASYPTRPLGRADLVSLTPGVTAEAANGKLAAPIAIYSRYNRPSEAEVAEVVAALQAQAVMAVAEVLERFAASRRAVIERGLIWLARHDILSIRPPG